jgi:hypothetical protein
MSKEMGLHYFTSLVKSQTLLTVGFFYQLEIIFLVAARPRYGMEKP